MFQKLKKHLFPLFIVLIVIIISTINYQPHTFLTGWDTLHPELNFPLNFKRLFFGVWRTEQGLGAFAAHSHMADLLRILILWLLHFILPLSALRYSYIFLCLLLGPLGVFYLAKFIFKKLPISALGRSASGRTNYQLPITSFLASLFYLFNLGTVQIFYVPFEMFPTQYAFLPFLILFSLKYLKSTKTRHLLYFSLFTLFATPQAYAPHLWYFFFLTYLVFLFLHFLFHQKKLLNYFKLILITLTLNSFWLLPNVYYTLTSSSTPQNSWTNRINSQEFLLKNRQFSTLKNTALNQGFYFDWNIYNFSSQNNQQLMPLWLSHLQNHDVLFIGYFIFFIALSGFILSLKNRHKNLISLSPFLLIPLILLLNSTFPFKFLFDLLLKIPLLAELFRFIFNKLSCLLILAITIYSTYFIQQIFKIISPKLQKVIIFFIPLSLLIYSWPIFTGQLISPQLKNEIPSSYFDFWSYMTDQKDGTVLSLPLHQPTGWQYYNWDYQGSGFIWFNLPQAITDRDFDRWQTKNEQLYKDFFSSLYAKNAFQFQKLLKKYNISYLLWDQNQINTQIKNQDQVIFKNEISALLDQLVFQNQIQPLKSFGNLHLYQTNIPTSLVQTQDHNNFRQNNLDFYNQILTPQNRIDTNLFKINPQNWQLSYQNQTYQLQPKQIPIPNRSHFFNIPHSQAYILALQSQYKSGIPIRLCLKNDYSKICSFEDQLSTFKNPDWDFFFIRPQDNFSGYILEINKINTDYQKASSQILKSFILPLPTDILNQLNPITPTYQAQNHNYKSIFPNNSFVSINLPLTTTNNHLVFNQSYDPSWLAFYFSGPRPVFLKNHTLANNWANSWTLPTNLPSNTTIYIFFWPQLLEFIGLLLIPASFFWFTRRSS